MFNPEKKQKDFQKATRLLNDINILQKYRSLLGEIQELPFILSLRVCSSSLEKKIQIPIEDADQLGLLNDFLQAIEDYNLTKLHEMEQSEAFKIF